MLRKAYEAQKNARHCSLLSNALVEQQKWEEAIQFAQQAIEMEKDNSVFHIRMGRLLTKMEKFEQAITAYSRALELEETADICVRISQNYRRLKNLPQALNFAQKAVTLDPQSQKYQDHLQRIQSSRSKTQYPM